MAGFLILTAYLWAQPRAASTKNQAAIQRVKALRVSSVDRSLPRVSLEFFLLSEGAGAPIEWQVNGCGEQAESHTADAKYDPPICVAADMNVADRAEVSVLFTVGTFKKGPVDPPTLFSIHITHRSGLVRQLQRLSDLPMELHRPQPVRQKRNLQDSQTETCSLGVTFTLGGQPQENGGLSYRLT